ncbi:MAG: response regulator [Chroococcidiopsidaceae cyanobacterium CP_BM_ER_R8_30]|nr:response regulator [Chroococcidiopsidaceae cyanobacterium CP_BM_ER_R8_30]
MSNNPKSPLSNNSEIQTASTLKRILLVENDDNNRELLSELLSYHGYSILALAGSSDFFEAVSGFRPNLILLDLKLDENNGYTLLEEIRRNEEYQDIPIIVISAYAFKAQIQRAYNLGVNGYIIKPINVSDLTQAIQDQLHRKGQSGADCGSEGNLL